MADYSDDPMAQCDALAQPMGALFGAGVGVPVGAGVMIGSDAAAGPAAPVALPFAIGAGATAGWGAYDQVRDSVSANWHDAVCEPLSAWAQGSPEVTSAPDAFCPSPTEVSASGFDFAGHESSFCATPDFGNTMDVSSGASDYGSSSSSYSSGGDYSAGSSSSSGDSSPSSD